MTCIYKIVETILASNFYFLLKLFNESNISYKICEKHLFTPSLLDQSISTYFRYIFKYVLKLTLIFRVLFLILFCFSDLLMFMF